VAAVAVLSETRSQKNRAVDQPDHFERGDLARIAGHLVAAIGAVLGSQKSILGQLLKNLRKQRLRDSVQVGDLFGTRTLRPMHHQVLQGDEPVIRFLGQL
jgi:hypothetical protein